MLLEAGPAEHWAPLGRLEGNRGLLVARGTARPRFGAHLGATSHPLGFALLAAFGIVFEILIVEEKLFARREDEFGATIHAFQHSVGKFHGRLPWSRA